MKKQKMVVFMAVMLTVTCMAACGQKTEQAAEQAPAVEEEATACEQNGHTWTEATCTEPKTCSVCGETEGEALGHTLTKEATYLQGIPCDVCGVVVGDPLQPVASEEDILNLQARMDALVETYNTANQEAIDVLAQHIREVQNNVETDDDAYVETMHQIFNETGTDYAWYQVTIPMAFYNNMNEGLLGQYSFDDYINTDNSTANSYLRAAQADVNNMYTEGIMLWNMIPYVKELAIGNPTVLDVVYYEEDQPAGFAMGMQCPGYGVIEANGKLYVADLLADNKIINIYSVDEGGCMRPLPDRIKAEEYDDAIEEIIVTGDMEYSVDENGMVQFTAKNVGDTIYVKYKGYIGGYRWVQSKEDEETNSVSGFGHEAYKDYYKI